MTQQPQQPGEHRQFGNPEVEPPALNRLQTTLDRPERKTRRHPFEIPWLAVGIGLTLVNYLAAIVLAIILAFGIQVDDGEGGNWITQLMLFAALLPLLIFFGRGMMYAQLRANSVRMSPTQFPEAYRMVCEAAKLHGLRRVPDAYVVAGNGTVNAFASGHGHRRFVAIYSDLFEIGGAARDPDALRFIIGHEVGHIAAGHTSYFRLVLTTTMNQIPVLSGFLSRAQEYTADNYGYRYCSRGAAGAIRVLAAGKYLNLNVDVNEFADRATTERGLFLWLTNLGQTHPVLTWRAQALRDRSTAGRLFAPPIFRPSGIGALPAGDDWTVEWASPEEALAYLEQHPPTGEPQFGRNFPVPLPGTEIARPPSGYGQSQLRHGWRDRDQNSAVGGGPYPFS